MPGFYTCPGEPNSKVKKIICARLLSRFKTEHLKIPGNPCIDYILPFDFDRPATAI